MKWTMTLLLGIALLSPKSWAEDAKPSTDLAAYLEQLQTKLDHAAQRANQPSSEGSSVVGLRGSRQESASKQLYWKGKTGSAPVSTDEVKEFRAAVELAHAGKTNEATTALRSFLDKYPKSAFRSDAEDSLKRLSPSVPASVKS